MIHPKVAVPAIVGVVLSVALGLATVVAGQQAVPAWAPVGAAAVTVLQFVIGFLVPGPISPRMAMIEAITVRVIQALADAIDKPLPQQPVAAAEPTRLVPRHAAWLGEDKPAPWRPVGVGNPEARP